MTGPPKSCPACGTPLPVDAARCRRCGWLPTVAAGQQRDDAPLDVPLPRERPESLPPRAADAGGGPRTWRDLAASVPNLDLGDRDVAARELAVALELAPGDASLHAHYAAVLTDLAATGRRGAERAAWEHVERALSLRPGLAEALVVKTRLLLARDDWREALAVARPALASDPGAFAPPVADLLLARAHALAARHEWLAALSLWQEAAKIAPGRVGPALQETLRAEQDVLLAPPRWSWLVYPPVPDRQRSLRYAAAAFVAAVVCLILFVVLAANDATLLLGIVPLLGAIVAPAVVLLIGRRRRRLRAAPHHDLVARIRANPAAIFRGEPPIDDMLAALAYVATERQGQEMARAHPWLLGRGSPVERRARRGALLRAPWMPSGHDDERSRP